MKWYNPWTWFPWTRQGRQTLIYLAYAGAGPALCLIVIWAMERSLSMRLFATFTELSRYVAWALLVSVAGLASFVSLRAVKMGPIEVEGSPDRGDDEEEDRRS